MTTEKTTAKILLHALYAERQGERSESQETLGALTICMENPVIPGRIQMERFIPVENFRKKVIPFKGCLPFDRKIRLECEKHNGKRFTNLPQKCHIRYGLNPNKGRTCVA